MSTEHIYTWAMIQLTLVLLLASTRLQPANNDKKSLRYFQLALAFDALSWFFYLWHQHPVWLFISSFAAALAIWLLLFFALSRIGRQPPWLGILPLSLLQAILYTQLSSVAALHLMTLVTTLVALPSAWIFYRLKSEPNVSDKLYALVMLCWFLICLARSIIAIVNPAFMLSGYLVSQLLWPAITTAYAVFAITGYLEETQQKLKTDAMLDPLTGLLNRRGMVEQVNLAVTELERHQQNATILLLDLDHFKRINDRYGHDCGDQVLVNVANTLKCVLRTDDIIARLGGEEFLVFLPNCPRQQASVIAQQLCQDIAAMPWHTMASGLETQTVSIGGCELSSSSDFTEAMQRADAALYQAKQQGRARWVFS